MGFNRIFWRERRTFQFLISPSPAAKRTQTPNEFLEVHRSSAAVDQSGSVGQVKLYPRRGSLGGWFHKQQEKGAGAGKGWM